MPNPQPPIYSTMIRANKAVYFVETKRTKAGAKYIQITQTMMNETGKKRVCIQVFEEAFALLRTAINEAVDAA